MAVSDPARSMGAAGAPPSPPGGWPAPRSLYVHVPFCRHRCGYCNFSVVAQRDDLQASMVDALITELRQLAPAAPLQTLFLGGGTPTHLSPSLLQSLVEAITEHFTLASDAEVSVEANPEDITPEMLTTLVELGVNRMSLGVQSFDDEKLRLLQRSHSAELATSTIDACHEAIGNVSIDLIFGTPGESEPQWRRDLVQAVATPISHVSTYALTFEKGTTFWNRRRRGELHGIDESVELAMDEATRSILPAAGLTRYEISNFAREGFRCQHNQAYWAGEGWHAIGPGAARFVDGRREVNHRSPTTYLRRMTHQGDATAESEPITLDQYARERAAFGVRQVEGVDLAELQTSTGIDLLETLAGTWREMTAWELIDRRGAGVRLTDRGLLFADTVASRILSDPPVLSGPPATSGPPAQP